MDITLECLPMTLVTMNQKEIERLKIVSKVIEKRLTKVQAAKILGITSRQVYRLQKAIEKQGPEGVVSKRRGQPSNRRYPEYFRSHVLDVVRKHYHDFGPTFASEKLAESHNLHIATETLRAWMIEAGIWTTRAKRRQRAYQPRYRRDCFGELVQIDGSHHHWFEDRAPKCTLLVYIDDATSRIQQLHFCKSENTFDYFKATRDYLEQHGKPVAFYSDKHSTFRVNKTGATTGTNMTQFGRALHELNIDIICANSAQAKGRVERANKTLQDRLVKELRLAGISSIEEANEFSALFLEKHNQKFAKPAANPKDIHRELDEYDDLDQIFTWQEERTVSNSLTIQYNRILFMLEPNQATNELRRERVTVYDYPDGQFKITHNGVELPYSVFDKVQQINQGEVVSNKRLGAVLDFATKQAENLTKRSKRGPKRHGQSSSLFKGAQL